MIKANVISDHSNWIKNIKNPNDYLNKRLKILSKAPFFKRKNHEFSVLLTNNKKMKKLNFKFRKKNKTTDVLSFPFYNKKELMKKLKYEKEIYLGDIIVNINKIRKNQDNTSFTKEFNKLWIHGLTHLFGYDHRKNSDFFEMLKIEKKFLSYLE